MATGLKDLVAKLRLDTTQFQKGLRGVASKLKIAGAAMTAATVGFAAAIKGQLDLADQMGESAQKFGVTTEALSKLKYAAQLSGVEFETMGTGLRKLTQNMASAASGNAKATAMFDGLGVAVTNADGTLRSADAVLADLSGVMAGMPDGAAKTALAMEVFGKSGAEMIPLLNQGKTAIEALGEEAASMGLVISGETATAAGNFNDSLDRITGTVRGLVAQIAAELAPTMERIAATVADAAKWFQDLSPEVRAVAAQFALVAMAAGPILLGLGLIIGPLQTVLGVMKSLALVALANPLVLIGVAAAAGAALIYLNWGSIKAWFADIWAGIKQTAADLWTSIGTLASDAVTATMNAWTGVKELFVLTLMNIKTAFVEGWQKIKDVTAQWVADFLAIGGQIVEGLKQGILEKWDAMVAWFKGKADALTANFRSWFGIASPSKVFKGYGRNISEGLAIGIAEQQPMVDSAMEGVGDSISGKGLSLAERMEDFKSAAQSAFVGFVTGAKSAKEALSDLLASMAQTLATQGFNALWGAIFPGFANGAAFSGGKVTPFASGGVVSGATAFRMQGGMGVMGEAGPEAIMPLTRIGGKLGVSAMGGGGGAMHVTVTMDPSTGAMGAFVRDQAGQVVAQARPTIVSQSVAATDAAMRKTKSFGSR